MSYWLACSCACWWQGRVACWYEWALRRVGPKGSRQFAEISWADALDIVAEQFIAKAALHGSETIWPYYYAGTMGLVMRDGINRLRHVMGYSRQKKTICTALCDAGWEAGHGAKRGLDGPVHRAVLPGGCGRLQESACRLHG